MRVCVCVCVYETINSISAEYIFLTAHGILSRLDNILSQKKKKPQEIEIDWNYIEHFFYDHNTLKVEINYKKKTKKVSNITLNDIILREIKDKSRIPRDKLK